jgi:HSP90 family molecular chaperone
VYLRFVRGIIDSEDLPLNGQGDPPAEPILRSITVASTKKLLSEFKTIAENNPEMYAAFSAEFNRPLKEGSIPTSRTGMPSSSSSASRAPRSRDSPASQPTWNG